MASSERGFTMVEALVALAIAALAMVALFRTSTQSTTASVSVETHLAAGALARSLLLDVAQTPIEKPFDRTGKAGSLSWKLSAAIAKGDLARLAPRGAGLYDVRVAVTWAPSGRLELNTIVLGR